MLNFVLPIFLGTLFQSLYTTIDAIIIGRFAGKDAFAAIESVLSFQRLPVSFFVGLSSGATIIISQYFGAKKKEEVSKASHTAILFAIVGGLLLSVLSCILSPFFIKLIKVPNEIFYQAQIYTIICFSGIVFSMVYNIGSGILRALGDSKTPFYILILSNILNIILDLKAGKIDAIILEKAVATEYMKKNPEMEIFDEKPASIGMAMAIDKGKNPELIKQINAELKKMRENGKYDELIKKYGLENSQK